MASNDALLKAISGRIFVAMQLIILDMPNEALEALQQLESILPAPDEINVEAALHCAMRKVYDYESDEVVH